MCQSRAGQLPQAASPLTPFSRRFAILLRWYCWMLNRSQASFHKLHPRSPLFQVTRDLGAD